MVIMDVYEAVWLYSYVIYAYVAIFRLVIRVVNCMVENSASHAGSKHRISWDACSKTLRMNQKSAQCIVPDQCKIASSAQQHSSLHMCKLRAT